MILEKERQAAEEALTAFSDWLVLVEKRLNDDVASLKLLDTEAMHTKIIEIDVSLLQPNTQFYLNHEVRVLHNKACLSHSLVSQLGTP